MARLYHGGVVVVVAVYVSTRQGLLTRTGALNRMQRLDHEPRSTRAHPCGLLWPFLGGLSVGRWVGRLAGLARPSRQDAAAAAAGDVRMLSAY